MCRCSQIRTLTKRIGNGNRRLLNGARLKRIGAAPLVWAGFWGGPHPAKATDGDSAGNLPSHTEKRLATNHVAFVYLVIGRWRDIRYRLANSSSCFEKSLDCRIIKETPVKQDHSQMTATNFNLGLSSSLL